MSLFNSSPRCCCRLISCSSSDTRARSCAISSSQRSTPAELASISLAELVRRRLPLGNLSLQQVELVPGELGVQVL